MTPPKEITIKSDGNLLKFDSSIKTKDGLLHRYIYSKSKSKKGVVLELNEQQLFKLINLNT